MTDKWVRLRSRHDVRRWLDGLPRHAGPARVPDMAAAVGGDEVR